MVIYVGFGGIWPSAASADVCGVCGWLTRISTWYVGERSRSFPRFIASWPWACIRASRLALLRLLRRTLALRLALILFDVFVPDVAGGAPLPLRPGPSGVVPGVVPGVGVAVPVRCQKSLRRFAPCCRSTGPRAP
jgi:hypothetical protein